jgi:signal peptidase I
MISITISALISDIAKYVPLEKNILSHPVYSYILWHVMLFSFVLVIFFDSRNGFRRTNKILSSAFLRFKSNGKSGAIHHAMKRYRERSKKVYLSRAFAGVAATLVLALMIYSGLVFFSVVVSDSMNPVFQRGDLVLMPNIFVKPEVGDIITFKVPEERLPVTHRIVSISGDEIRTKGDMNSVQDSWRITKSQILGKAVYISGHPVVINKVGDYFIIDVSSGGRTYGPEFNAISKLIRGVKSAGTIGFILCIILYLVLSFRDARRTRW